jgi:hypothetical protein
MWAGRRPLLLALVVVLASTGCRRPRQLIEWGWDEPDTAFLRRHIAQMERTPFDGCVFHASYPTQAGKAESFAWKVWGQRAFERRELEAAVEDLRATPRTRFRELFLRVNVTPGDVDWFDDFGPVLGNLRLAAEVAHSGGCRGLMFDDETYDRPIFDYRRQKYAATRSWDEYAAQARRRGREAMESLQQGFPDARVMLTFGYELPWRQSQSGQRALSQCDYGLLAPFLDGLVDAVRGARLIDAYEFSYGYKEPVQFWTGYDDVRRRVRPIVADPDKYHRVSTVGFGLWMDFNRHLHAWDEVAYDRNHFTPEAFERALRAAWDTTDEYVWIYSETPRWWTEEGRTLHLPEVYEAAARRVRREGRGREPR